MDQVKKGSRTLLDLFQAFSAKKCRPNKGLDSPTPGQVQMTQAMLHRPPKSANRIISATTKNHQTTENDTSDQKKKKPEKMKFNPRWLEK